MELVWNDGGRSACGFVGTTGDCVTRSIAIATGTNYRDIYDRLGEAAMKSPRNGVQVSVAEDYLRDLGWKCIPIDQQLFEQQVIPRGVAIVQLSKGSRRSRHFCTIIDHVIHDTWNPYEDGEYIVEACWTRPATEGDVSGLISTSTAKRSAEQELTQKEFDKILKRLRALDNTASNRASTEGEKRNAIRMMQHLMLRHNLSREDIVDKDNVEYVQFTRMACPLNGRRACGWEKMLAAYVTGEIFPMVQWYVGRRAHRTWFWFYGPLSDVQNTITLFRELLVTIAAAAHLQYGGHTRGSGASYAEGYVAGLPRGRDLDDPGQSNQSSSNDGDPASDNTRGLIQTRTLALHNAARKWLSTECDIQLQTSSGSGRHQHDPTAAVRGRQHGSKHTVQRPGKQLRITGK